MSEVVAGMPGAIMICGIQQNCRGNRADGMVTFNDSDNNDTFTIPCCNDCYDYLYEQEMKMREADNNAEETEQK